MGSLYPGRLPEACWPIGLAARGPAQQFPGEQPPRQSPADRRRCEGAGCAIWEALSAVAIHPCVSNGLGRVGRIIFGIVPGADVLRVVLVEGGLEVGVGVLVAEADADRLVLQGPRVSVAMKKSPLVARSRSPLVAR